MHLSADERTLNGRPLAGSTSIGWRNVLSRLGGCADRFGDGEGEAELDEHVGDVGGGEQRGR
jgi:hypothetical protein